MPGAGLTALFFVVLSSCCESQDVNCTTDGHSRICYFASGFSPDRVVIDGDYVFVGSTDRLFKFSEELQLIQALDVSPNRTRYDECKRSEAVTMCRNFVRLVQPIRAAHLAPALQQRYNDTLLVCGSNAFFPKCSVHKRTNLSAWFYVTAEDHPDLGFSPYSKEQNMGLLADNGNYYAATIFQRFQHRSRIAVARNPLEHNATFIAGTQENSPVWLRDTAQFVSMLETETHVYVFAREPAFEVDNGQSVVFSRTIRICKTDTGIMEGEIQPGDIARFQTYQKLRLKCSHGSNFPFDYNELTSVHVHTPSTSNAVPVVYATFSASSNGPQGSAICKFSFDALTTIFNSGRYLVKSLSAEWTPVTSASFVCPGNPNGPQRENTASLNNLLMLESADASAMYRIERDEYTQIVGDSYQYGQYQYEVIYVGKKNGEVWALIRRDDSDFAQYRLFAPKSPMKPITRLLVDTNPTNKTRRLFVSTEDLISKLTLGNCAGYVSCTECLESNDPYCVWLDNTQQCHNKLTNLSPIQGSLETVVPRNTTEIATICNVPPPTTLTVEPSHSVGTPAVPDSSVRVACSSPSSSQRSTPPQATVGVTDGVATEPPSKGFPLTGTIGIAVGGLLIGLIIGMLGCLIGLVMKRVLVGTKSSDPVVISHTEHNGQPHNSTGTIEITSQYSLSTSPPIPVVSPEDDDDDVITDLPTKNSSTSSKANKYPVPRGRTPSTRWLRASESSNCDYLPSP